MMSAIGTADRLVRYGLRRIAHAIVHPVETVEAVTDLADVAEATATALMDALQQADAEPADWLMTPERAPGEVNGH